MLKIIIIVMCFPIEACYRYCNKSLRVLSGCSHRDSLYMYIDASSVILISSVVPPASDTVDPLAPFLAEADSQFSQAGLKLDLIGLLP